MYKKYAVIAVLLIWLTACSKREAITERIYYADLSVTISKLPGTPDTDVFLDGQLLGTLAPEAPLNKFRVTSGEKGKVSLFKAGTKDLIADTIISIERNSKVELTALNSETLGLKGWKPATKVPDDIMSLQLFDALNEKYPEVLDVYIYMADNMTLELFDTGIVLRNFTRNKLHPLMINLPVKPYPGGNQYLYIIKMKAPGSDEWIMNEALGLDIIPLTSSDGFSNGKFGIFSIRDDDGFIQGNTTYL